MRNESLRADAMDAGLTDRERRLDTRPREGTGGRGNHDADKDIDVALGHHARALDSASEAAIVEAVYSLKGFGDLQAVGSSGKGETGAQLFCGTDQE